MNELLQYPKMMADIELCYEQLLEICQGKHNKAVMSIPPRQADFDMQMSAAFDELKAYRELGTVEQYKQSISAWNTMSAKEAEQRQKKFEELKEIAMKKMTDIEFSEDDTCEKYCSDCPHRICDKKLEGQE